MLLRALHRNLLNTPGLGEWAPSKKPAPMSDHPPGKEMLSDIQSNLAWHRSAAFPQSCHWSLPSSLLFSQQDNPKALSCSSQDLCSSPSTSFVLVTVLVLNTQNGKAKIKWLYSAISFYSQIIRYKEMIWWCLSNQTPSPWTNSFPLKKIILICLHLLM